MTVTVVQERVRVIRAPAGQPAVVRVLEQGGRVIRVGIPGPPGRKGDKGDPGDVAGTIPWAQITGKPAALTYDDELQDITLDGGNF